MRALRSQYRARRGADGAVIEIGEGGIEQPLVPELVAKVIGRLYNAAVRRRCGCVLSRENFDVEVVAAVAALVAHVARQRLHDVDAEPADATLLDWQIEARLRRIERVMQSRRRHVDAQELFRVE